VVVRNPGAVRPWQHVLDPLSGYLRLGAKLMADDPARFAAAFNFGPDRASAVPVSEVVDRVVAHWPGGSWVSPDRRDPAPHEAHFLMLDHAKAVRELGWTPTWGLGDAVGRTAEWYRAMQAGTMTPRAFTEAQVAGFAACAREAGAS